MALLSGFDLAVSIVVALSSPLEAISSPVQHATMEQLSDLYTGEGWEFIDLDEEDAESIAGSDRDEQEGNRPGQEELHGIARIREALQTHIWPDLIQKNGSKVKRMHSSTNEVKGEALSISQAQGKDEIERTMAMLQMDLKKLDTASEAKPTKQDEELAEAFFRRIMASQAAASSSSRDAEQGPHTLASMQADLEQFLESEDTEWPVAVTSQSNADQDEEAWSIDDLPTATLSTAPAFDDDFSDFVQGPGSLGNHIGAAFHLPIHELDTELELDDIALMEAFEREGSGGTRNGISFESTLSAVMAQAERVQSIRDRQKRREEAARIALTLVGEQP